MFVANRRRERAIALAQRFGGASGSFDALPGELERADIVIASTASPHTLLGAEEIGEVMTARRGRPLLLVDLAVPRDIDAQCGELPGVTVLDMDALQRTVSPPHAGPPAEARRAEGIVEEEIQTFAGWLGQLEVLPTLVGAARPRRRGRRPAAGRERRPLGEPHRRATASASRRSPARSSTACCTSRPSA